MQFLATVWARRRGAGQGAAARGSFSMQVRALGAWRGSVVGRWAPRGWGQRAWSWRRDAVMRGAAGAPSQRAFLRFFLDFDSIVSIRGLIGIFLGTILGVVMILLPLFR